MKDAWHWLQAAQHEWWFFPAAVLIILTIFGVTFGVRIASSRLIGKIMTPRLKLHEDQVDAQWATAADLEAFGLVTPAKKGLRKWIAR